ncbi:MAG: hypothetical protein M1831_006110 [Alyxoria varia]|nr:MAG: hypothetical protein M1831_006110 [Alyxoria varia]
MGPHPHQWRACPGYSYPQPSPEAAAPVCPPQGPPPSNPPPYTCTDPLRCFSCGIMPGLFPCATAAPPPFYPPVSGPPLGPPPGPPPAAACDPKPAEANITLDGVPEGAKLLMPKKFVHINVTKTKLEGEPGVFAFDRYVAPPGMLLRDLIEELGGGNEHSISEGIEMGNGKWYRPRTIAHRDEPAALPLKILGWSDKGTVDPPLWLSLHK